MHKAAALELGRKDEKQLPPVLSHAQLRMQAKLAGAALVQ
jgi:hypothetical protein